MDSKNYERISNFMDAWGYKLDDLRMYLRTVAPDLKVDPRRKLHEGMNDFLSGLCGRKEAAESKPKMKGKFIPQPEGSKEGLAYDLWMRFSDEFSLEDLADYASERAANMAREKEQRAENDSMGMSRMIYAMGSEERAEQKRFNDEMFAKHERIVKEGKEFNMNDLLHGPAADRYSKMNIVAPVEERSEISSFLGSLDNIDKKG